MRLEKTAGGRPSVLFASITPLPPSPRGYVGPRLQREVSGGGSFDGVRQNVAAKARAGRWDVRRWRRRRRSLDLQGGQSGGSEEELR
jgi:hypothetical protein